MAMPVIRLFGALHLCQRPVQSVTITVTASRNIKLSPEAPSFFIPPIPPQSEEPVRKRERGHLPVPRRIMRTDKIVRDKTDQGFIQRTAPRAKRRRLPLNFGKVGPKNALRAGRHDVLALLWRKRSAHDRRENLAIGITALAKRKKTREQEAAVITLRRRTAAKKIVEAAEDEADRLTRPTVPPEILITAVADDPARFQKARASLARTTKMFQRHRTARQDSITELYMNAKTFIVTEEELEATVQKLFTAAAFKDSEVASGVPNVWANDPPWMESHDNTWSAAGMMGELVDKKARKTGMRHEKVGEALTGGKLRQ